MDISKGGTAQTLSITVSLPQVSAHIPLDDRGLLIGTFFSRIWFVLSPSASIGYGDLTPIRQDTRLFAVIFIPLVRASTLLSLGHWVCVSRLR